jgi:uncharacterized protein YidB (DUF937 family)
MGLMDVLNGMQNGPHGPRGGATGTTSSSGGMSPITMAVIGLVAYKAFKSFTSQPGSAPAGAGAGSSVPSSQAAGPGGLGDILKGGLGGLLAGGAAGGALSGGLNDLLKQFQDAGHGNTADSWVGNGPNKTVSADDFSKILNPDQIKTLTSQTGLSQDQLLSALSQHLPALVHELTPDGRVPTEQEVARLFQ